MQLKRSTQRYNEERVTAQKVRQDQRREIEAAITEIRKFFKEFRFEAAERAFLKHQPLLQLAGITNFNYEAESASAREIYHRRLVEKIKELLSRHQFDEADQLYQDLQHIISKKMYDSLRKKFWSAYEAKRRKEEQKNAVAQLLAQARFDEADQYVARTDSLISTADYIQRKVPYIQKDFRTRFQIDMDSEQAIAISWPAHSLLVTARAGSGKTRVMTCKATYLLTHENVKPDEIIMLAFNNAAAREMHQRMHESFHLASFQNALTFHALARRLIQPGDRVLENDRDKGRVVKQAIANAWADRSFAYLTNEYFRRELAEEATWSTNVQQTEIYTTKRNEKHLTLKGDEVKSAGEKYIADFLYEHGIAYTYEYAHTWDDQTYRPDFTLFADGGIKTIIEHWGIDESDPKSSVPPEWTRSTDEYKAEMQAKRGYWQSQGIPLVETSIRDLKQDRELFEQSLQVRLEAAGIACVRQSYQYLRDKLPVEKEDRFTKLCLRFITRAKAQGLSPQRRDLRQRIGEDDTKEAIFWDLGMRVFYEYEEEKRQQNKLDYDDLLRLSANKIKETDGNCTFNNGETNVAIKRLHWVLIDEFQDFSQLFFKLVSAMRQCNPQLKLFCVGDDWQAINGFMGSDLSYFQQFEETFKDATRLHMLTNYRSRAKIVQKGNQFMHGKGTPARPRDDKPSGEAYLNYINKIKFEPDTMGIPNKTAESTESDQRFLFGNEQDKKYLAARTLKCCYEVVNRIEHQEKSFAILSRTNLIYGQQLELFRNKLLALTNCPPQNLTLSTVHRFKGLEADIVILVEVIRGRFPLVHKDNRLYANFVNGNKNVDALAEEEDERLFYVALTRATEKLWILTEEKRESKFVQRIKKSP